MHHHAQKQPCKAKCAQTLLEANNYTDSLTEEDERVEEVVLEGVPPRPEGLLRLGAAEDLQGRPTKSGKKETRDDGSAKKSFNSSVCGRPPSRRLQEKPQLVADYGWFPSP